jgi:hypothetical protein
MDQLKDLIATQRAMPHERISVKMSLAARISLPANIAESF